MQPRHRHLHHRRQKRLRQGPQVSYAATRNSSIRRLRAGEAGADRRVARPEPEGGLAKGQTTAIVTGVVSILFGVRHRPKALCFMSASVKDSATADYVPPTASCLSLAPCRWRTWPWCS